MPKVLSRSQGIGVSADPPVCQDDESRLREPQYDVEVKLHDLQEDPNSPLYSVKSFEQLGL